MDKEIGQCHTCGNMREKDNGRIIIDQIFICSECIPKILLLHIYTQPIKWICPHCQGRGSSICRYCDLSFMLNRIK